MNSRNQLLLYNNTLQDIHADDWPQQSVPIRQSPKVQEKIRLGWCIDIHLIFIWAYKNINNIKHTLLSFYFPILKWVNISSLYTTKANYASLTFQRGLLYQHLPPFTPMSRDGRNGDSPKNNKLMHHLYPQLATCLEMVPSLRTVRWS